MMLLVDGSERALDGDEKSIRQEVIQLVNETVDGGRHIRMITLNGQETSVDSITALEFRPGDEISVVTCSLDELIEDAMGSAAEYTPKLLAALVECSKLLRVGNVGEAGGVFADTVPGVHWTYDILRDLTSFHPGPSPVHELFEQAGNVIPQLLQAWDAEDYVFLADLIEYELIPVLERWLYVTQMFASQMQAERIKQGLFKQ